LRQVDWRVTIRSDVAALIFLTTDRSFEAAHRSAVMRVRAQADLLNRFRVIWEVQSLPEKFSALLFPANQLSLRCVLFRKEGRWPSSRTLGRDAVDARPRRRALCAEAESL
jgi:hypothetical protein